jgi:hypothetical protein
MNNKRKYEVWGSYDKKKKIADVGLIISGGMVINGWREVARSKNGKNIWSKTYPETKSNCSDIKFLGFYETKYTDDREYNEAILDIEKQIKKNPKLVSKDGIGPKPSKKKKTNVVDGYIYEEPPF